MIASAAFQTKSWTPSTTAQNDQERLVHAAQNGDLDAFNQIVLDYQDMVYNLAYHMLFDPDVAEDIAQTVFITLYHKIGTFRGGNFRSWLLRVTANACHDELRRRRRRTIFSLDDPGDDEQGPAPIERLVADQPSPEQVMEQAELRQVILAGMKKLPEDFRAVLTLVDLQGLDYQEAAEVLNRPTGTIKSRLARARMQMRHHLQHQLAV